MRTCIIGAKPCALRYSQIPRKYFVGVGDVVLPATDPQMLSCGIALRSRHLLVHIMHDSDDKRKLSKAPLNTSVSANRTYASESGEVNGAHIVRPHMLLRTASASASNNYNRCTVVEGMLI